MEVGAHAAGTDASHAAA